jgi:hypothetical protein
LELYPPKAFFTFTELVDASLHRAYNAWHQLDHRPENLALPGVIYGERWVKSPDCTAGTATPLLPLSEFHYFNMYWFREPERESIREFWALAERSMLWGRRPDRMVRRPLVGWLMPVKGYVSPRVRVSEGVLPLRPNRGVYLTVSRLNAPGGKAAEETFAWYDRVRIPDLLLCRGAAGVWTLVSPSSHAGLPRLGESDARRTKLRVQLVYLDEDPLEFRSDLQAKEHIWRRSGRHRDTSDVEDVLFEGPLRSITPWEWDWFEPIATNT